MHRIIALIARVISAQYDINMKRTCRHRRYTADHITLLKLLSMYKYISSNRFLGSFKWNGMLLFLMFALLLSLHWDIVWWSPFTALCHHALVLLCFSFLLFVKHCRVNYSNKDTFLPFSFCPRSLFLPSSLQVEWNSCAFGK